MTSLRPTPTPLPPPSPSSEVQRAPRLARGSCANLHVVETVVLLAGSMVGTYRLVACTARGRNAEQWEAVDSSRRTVIVKVASRRTTSFDHDAVRKTSPHLAAVFAHGTLVDGRSYVVTEKIEGVSLRRWLAAYSMMTVRATIAIATQLARALACAHASELVHGAITPEHVMIRPDPESASGVRVTLLGLGTSLGLGSPGYLAPEQLANERTDARTDVFAIGALVVEMLSGRGPFAPIAIDTCAALARRRAGIAPRIELPDEHACMRRVLERALAADPADRFATVDELVGELAALS